MTDHKQTYKSEADQYDQLVSYEDYQGNLLPAIQQIVSLQGKDILELGAGTGRLTKLMAPYSRKVFALDILHAMLEVAHKKMANLDLKNWRLRVADHRNLPIADHSMEIIISGWSICYLVDWYRSTWKKELKLALDEMHRVLRKNGIIILIETQGTGFETPHPPDHLFQYFEYLEHSGFDKIWIRTDYKFSNLETAEKISRFFFGDELADQVKLNNWVVLPECTGLWWKRV
jgi:ubiquinone/menaquinone biosynthesis C-methylase UbiE